MIDSDRMRRLERRIVSVFAATGEYRVAMLYGDGVVESSVIAWALVEQPHSHEDHGRPEMEPVCIYEGMPWVADTHYGGDLVLHKGERVVVGGVPGHQYLDIAEPEEWMRGDRRT